MTKQDYWIIVEALRKVRQTWGLTDSVNTRDEALFNDVVDSISRSLRRDNSGFKPETFSNAIYGVGSHRVFDVADYVRDEQASSDEEFINRFEAAEG